MEDRCDSCGREALTYTWPAEDGERPERLCSPCWSRRKNGADQ